VWDKSFFRTERFASLEALGTENEAFIAFHNTHHRYSAHAGCSPAEIWPARAGLLTLGYEPPTSLPARGRIEVVRYVRSNRILNLIGCDGRGPSPQLRPSWEGRRPLVIDDPPGHARSCIQ